MMCYQPDAQPKLFYHSFNLDERIPANSVLRKIRGLIDFEFIYREVKDCYSGRGNVSVPPPVILKMMLLLILYNVRSERELMNTLATIKKYSFSFCSRVLNIRNVVDRFLKDSLSTARGYQCFAKRML